MSDIENETREVMSDEEGDGLSPSSALEENIMRKGKNSYYYAHSKKLDAPAWDGNAEPRLLNREARASKAAEPLTEAITSYAWGDEKEKVKIYVTLKEEDVPDDNISLEYTETSLSLQVLGGDGAIRVLSLARLYDEIAEASFRRKKERVTITLKKKEEKKATWWELKKE